MITFNYLTIAEQSLRTINLDVTGDLDGCRVINNIESRTDNDSPAIVTTKQQIH